MQGPGLRCVGQEEGEESHEISRAKAESDDDDDDDDDEEGAKKTKKAEVGRRKAWLCCRRSGAAVDGALLV